MFQIRKTKRVSFFPVGLIGELGVSSPIVKDGKIVGYFDAWKGNRKFPVDMAGFAVHLNTVRTAWNDGVELMPFSVGYEEDGFLKKLGLGADEGEPLADDCSKILVWHTRTYTPNIENNPLHNETMFLDTNIMKIYPIL